MNKVPIRMCMVCRAHKEKNELIRVVKNKEGSIFINKSFKADGRGAYICKEEACVNEAQKKRCFERAFSCKIEPELYAQLREEVQNG